MSAFTMAWHRECYSNALANVKRRRSELARMAADVEKSEHDLRLYAEQIATAEKMGKASFDRERFLAKRTA